MNYGLEPEKKKYFNLYLGNTFNAPQQYFIKFLLRFLSNQSFVLLPP